MAKKKQAVSYKTAALQKAKRDKYYKIIALIAFFIVWELLGRINLQKEFVEPKFVPMPSEIIFALIKYAKEGTLWMHLGVSIKRVLGGYVIGVIIAIILGTLIDSIKTFDNIMTPILNLFGPIPIMAFLPMFLLWFGIGESSKIILIAYATIIYTWPFVTEGLRNTDPVLIRSGISLGASNLQIFWHIKFQSAFPNIFLGMKGALGTAFGAMVVAEMMGASTGLGYIIVFSKNWFMMSDMVMAAIVIGLLFSLMNAVLTVIENILFRWKKESVGNAVES